MSARKQFRCNIAGCNRKHHARGYCKVHHNNLMRNGKPEPLISQHRGPIAERLSSHSEANGDCIRWTGCLDPDGYGQVRFEGSMRKAHAVAWAVANGPVPKGMEVDHTCHNRDCIAVEHLRLVTHKQNAENRAGLRSTNTTGATGVVRRPNGRFQASVVHHGKRHHVGTFDTVAEANRAAREMRLDLFTHNDIDHPHYDEESE